MTATPLTNSSSQLDQSVTQAGSLPISESPTLSQGLCQITIPDVMNKVEIKECLDRAMEWLDERSTEKASTLAIIFQVNPASIQMYQYRKRH